MFRKLEYIEQRKTVRVNDVVQLPEGSAIIREITDDWRVLVEFEDPKIRPMYRLLEPEVIGAKLIEGELPKPPLGLRPRFIWVAQRVQEIREAIDRYKADGVPIPAAWLTELNALSTSAFQPSKATASTETAFVYHEAYSPQLLAEMSTTVLSHILALKPLQVVIEDMSHMLVLQNAAQGNKTVCTVLSDRSEYAYLIAFLLNNANHILENAHAK